MDRKDKEMDILDLAKNLISSLGEEKARKLAKVILDSIGKEPDDPNSMESFVEAMNNTFEKAMRKAMAFKFN